MASSYDNDLRLNEMATGDGSGTWGETTNTNLELIAEAFSYGTEVITTNADTHTTTIADGATDPGRSLYLKYTGTLDSACTITIAPNDISKVWIIENGTSGSQNIILSQGSGANITIPAGDTKVVYSDGAGAGAAFFDAFASLSVVDLKVQDDLTVTDDASIGGDATITGTLGVTGNITGTLATAAQPNITSVGTLTGFTSTGIDDNATSTAITIDSSENVGIGSTSPDELLTLRNADPTLLIQGNQVSGVHYSEIDFKNQAGSVLGKIGLSYYGGVAEFYRNVPTSWSHVWKVNNSEKMRLDSSGDVGIGTSSPAGLLHLSETADGTKLRITKGGLCEWDFSIGNTSTLTGVGAGALELLPLNAGTTNEFAIGTAGTTAPLFHLKNDQNYFAQKVGIGTTTPGSFDAEANNLVVGSGSGDEGITIFTGSSVGDYGSIFFGDATGTPKQGQIRYEQNNEVMSFYTNTSEKMRIDLNGSVLIGTSTTPTYAHKLVVAGSSIPDGIAAIEDDDVSVGLANAILRLTFSQDSECTSGYVIYMTDANNVIGSVTVASGTTVNYNTSSDERLKENIVDASSQLNTIKNIKVREFDWKKGGHHQVGLIAQELQTLIPDVVSAGGDDEAKNPYGVDYGKLTPYIVKAMQEQQTIIESLTARITTLEG
jgi:hypothetical protein